MWSQLLKDKDDEDLDKISQDPEPLHIHWEALVVILKDTSRQKQDNKDYDVTQPAVLCVAPGTKFLNWLSLFSGPFVKLGVKKNKFRLNFSESINIILSIVALILTHKVQIFFIYKIYFDQDCKKTCHYVRGVSLNAQTLRIIIVNTNNRLQINYVDSNRFQLNEHATHYDFTKIQSTDLFLNYFITNLLQTYFSKFGNATFEM